MSRPRRSPRIAILSRLNISPRASVQGLLDRIRSPGHDQRGNSAVEGVQQLNTQSEELEEPDHEECDKNEEAISKYHYSTLERAKILHKMGEDYLSEFNSWFQHPSENPAPLFPISSVNGLFDASTVGDSTDQYVHTGIDHIYETMKDHENIINEFNEKKKDERVVTFSAEILELKLFRYLVAIEKVALRLHNYSGLGNETEVSTTKLKTNLKIDEDRIDIQYDGYVKPSAEELENINQCEKEYVSHLLEQASSILDQDQMSDLQNFHGRVKDLFQKATPVKNSLRKKKRSLNPKELKGLKNTRDAILQGVNLSILPNTSYCIPSRKWNDETTADHPILQAIIFVIGDIVSSSSSTSSRDKASLTTGVTFMKGNDVTKERNIHSIQGPEQTVSTTKGRRIDLMHGIQHQEYMTVIHSSMLRTPIEFKTAPDDENKLNDTITKGSNQICSHLAKKVNADLHFAGIGRNGSATGIVLTQHAFKIIKLSLSDTGTGSIKLSCTETPVIQLWDELTEEVIGTTGNEYDNMLTCFHVLAGALIEGSVNNEMKDTNDEIVLSSDNHQGDNHQDISIRSLHYLGSGSFANVFAVPVTTESGEQPSINHNLFWKVPKCASLEKNLENEATILKILGHENENIPAIEQTNSLLSSVSVKRTTTHELSKIRVLELRGVIGKNLHQMFPKEWNEVYGLEVIKQVLLALKHAHGKNVLHLDIRPGNITYYVDSHLNNIHVMLIDWGCAVKKDWKGGFRGTVPYAHDKLMKLTQKIKFDDDAFDYASLMYTVDHCREGKLRWNHSFDRPSAVDDGHLDVRRRHVKESLDWFNEKMHESGTRDDFSSTFDISLLYKACGCKLPSSNRKKRRANFIPRGKNKRD